MYADVTTFQKHERNPVKSVPGSSTLDSPVPSLGPALFAALTTLSVAITDDNMLPG